MMEAYRNKEAYEQGVGDWFFPGWDTLVFGRTAASFCRNAAPLGVS